MTTWRNKLYILLLSLAIISCAARQPKIYEQLPLINPKLQPLADKFERIYRIKILKLNLLFKKGIPSKAKHRTVLGICRQQRIPLVQINSLTYGQLSPARQEALVFHELGHCIFNLDHVEAKFDDGCPTSLMYKNLIDEECYRLHYKHYLRDLRRRRRGETQ